MMQDATTLDQEYNFYKLNKFLNKYIALCVVEVNLIILNIINLTIMYYTDH
jgi:hypothetical protein